MGSVVEQGPLFGRPFGGMAVLIHNTLRSYCETITSGERFMIIKLFGYIIANVYLPCNGTAQRLNLTESVLNDIICWREKYPNCAFILAGDFNIDLDRLDGVGKNIVDIIESCGLFNCYRLHPNTKFITFCNESLGHTSLLDYFFTTKLHETVDISVLDLDSNFSDHSPVMATLRINIVNVTHDEAKAEASSCALPLCAVCLRWDHADISLYYEYCRSNLEPVLQTINDTYAKRNELSDDNITSIINDTYSSIIGVLSMASNLYIPHVKKNALKFWWDEEMSQLKADSVMSNRAWIAASKPRSGPIFQRRQSCRLMYRRALRNREQQHRVYYSNALHESLISKDTKSFWRCWRSKLDNANVALTIDGTNDPEILVVKFADYFSSLVCPNSTANAASLEKEFNSKMLNYHGDGCYVDDLFPIELVEECVFKLKPGTAADLYGLSAEHMFNCHPIIFSILRKLFILIVLYSYVPDGFGQSYTVPLLKVKDYLSKSLTCSDFRGIAISGVISKIFEHCLLVNLQKYLVTDRRQFGFKKSSGCSNAIFTLRTVVENFVAGGCTANLCSLDISKAFDKVNHHALFIKLMNRNIPVLFLKLIVNWLSLCSTCIKWYGHFSDFYSLDIGVRQGSVLAPFLFAVCINDIVKCCSKCRFGAQLGEILVYADDIVIVTRSITGLQIMIDSVVKELCYLDLTVNCIKSSCMRIGCRFKAVCPDILVTGGMVLPWVTELRYLGIVIVAANYFKCSFAHVKKSFCRAVNAILGKLGQSAHEDIVLHLIRSKCLPVLLYASEACPFLTSDLRSLDFMVMRFLMKLFHTGNRNVVIDTIALFGFVLPSELIPKRTERFLVKLRLFTTALCHVYQ
jgi:hypothetical protein